MLRVRVRASGVQSGFVSKQRQRDGEESGLGEGQVKPKMLDRSGRVGWVAPSRLDSRTLEMGEAMLYCRQSVGEWRCREKPTVWWSDRFSGALRSASDKLPDSAVFGVLGVEGTKLKCP